MTEQELFEISKRSGFITEPGVVSAGPYQVIHHTSFRFEYDEHFEPTEEEKPEEPSFNPDPAGNWILVNFSSNGTEVSVGSVGEGFDLSNFEVGTQYTDKESNPECFPTIYYTIDGGDVEEYSGTYLPTLQVSTGLSFWRFVLPMDSGEYLLRLYVENNELTGEGLYTQSLN